MSSLLPSLFLPHTLQVGSMVVYLCSEDARQVTGSTLTIDGGWTTH